MKQLEIRWARSVARLDSPALCRDHDDVADRILHVVVRVQVRWMEAGEHLLDLLVSPYHARIGAEVIAEEQGVALVGPAHLTDVQVGAPLSLRRAEEQLAPLPRRIIPPRREMVARYSLPERVSVWGGCRYNRPGVRGRHRDLHVDDVLRSQPGDRGRADVIDAHRQISHDLAQWRTDAMELYGPLLVIWDNFD